MSKILMQVSPTVGVMTDAYEVSEDRVGGVYIDHVRIGNRTTGKIKATISIAPEGEDDAVANHMAPNIDCPAGKITPIPINLTVPAFGIVRVRVTGAATCTVVGD